jgi:hypothetical protein
MNLKTQRKEANTFNPQEPREVKGTQIYRFAGKSNLVKILNGIPF